MDNVVEKTIAGTRLDSVEFIELLADFEARFDCQVVTEQLLEIDSLSDMGVCLHQAAIRSPV